MQGILEQILVVCIEQVPTFNDKDAIVSRSFGQAQLWRSASLILNIWASLCPSTSEVPLQLVDLSRDCGAGIHQVSVRMTF